jgi:hypothetical protein
MEVRGNGNWRTGALFNRRAVEQMKLKLKDCRTDEFKMAGL